jgi:hypothetical protein
VKATFLHAGDLDDLTIFDFSGQIIIDTRGTEGVTTGLNFAENSSWQVFTTTITVHHRVSHTLLIVDLLPILSA